MKKSSLFFTLLIFNFLLLPLNSFSQASGSLDSTFQMGTGANNYIYATAIQGDGKILIGGNFTSFNGAAMNRIARLNIDRTLDTTFNVGTGVNGSVLSIVTQSDGKIIIGGYIISYNGTSVNHIARLNMNGTLDTTFHQGFGANNSLLTTAIQNNGKIIIGGAFTAYNGTSRNHVARLNTDGTLDTTFNAPSSVSSTGGLHSISIQSDGKIIIGGTFGFNNIGGHVARLNINGSIDSTFALGFGIGANNDVYTTAIQSDGKVIVGGAFTSYGPTLRNYIARVNSNGHLDTTFVVGTGTNMTILTIQIQSDGKIIIGGYLTQYNGYSINRIARLNPNGNNYLSITLYLYC